MNANDRLLQIGMLLQAQRDAHRLAPFPEWQARRDRLQRLRKMLVDNESAIEDAIDADFGGRPRIETQVAEVFPSLAEIRAALRGGRRWMKPRSAWVSKWFLPARAWIMPRPVGVVGIIVPWNYPLYLTIGPLAGAIAAGNRALIKLSEYTPAFSALLQRLVAEAFAAEEIAVVTGGPEVAEAFAALPFDHLLFTGSGSVGRKVMAAASANLTPITLELGGKSPAVIAPGYSIERAATRIMAGKLLNAGQTCIAPDYALVPEGRVREFVAAAQAAVAAAYPDPSHSPDYTSIVDARHFARLASYVAEAQALGAEVVTMPAGAAPDPARRRYPPTLIVGAPEACRVMREEIFGPILPVVPYADFDAALAYVNARPRPLALYCFDRDAARVRRVLTETVAGGVTVNDTILHIAQDDLPFGGVGASGMGHYHGRDGFLAFSKQKGVFRQARWNAMALFKPPYGKTFERLVDFLLR